MNLLSSETHDQVRQAAEDAAVCNDERLDWIAGEVVERAGLNPRQHTFVVKVLRLGERVADEWPPSNTDHLPI